jgi:hypothetical protein
VSCWCSSTTRGSLSSRGWPPGDIVGPQVPVSLLFRSRSSHDRGLRGARGEVRRGLLRQGGDGSGLAAPPAGQRILLRCGRVDAVSCAVAPLVWDGTFPSPHPTGFPQWTAGRGFEVLANGVLVTISSVVIAGDVIQITCASDLTGSTVSVGYAYTADGVPMPGGTARWGYLRDSASDSP